MPENDQNAQPILTPGDGPGDAGNSDTSSDSPEIVALKSQNATLRAALDDAVSKLQELETVPVAAPPVAEVRYIGQDWSGMTSAEARAKGCTRTVLCSDGYFVP